MSEEPCDYGFVNCRCSEPAPEHDAVNHPAHYTQGGIETIDAIETKGGIAR